MQVNPSASGHEQTKYCWEGWAKTQQYAAHKASCDALDKTFTAYGEELEQVEVFKYLGRQIAMDDNDGQAAHNNLKKARKCWGRLSWVLRAENASPRGVRTLLQSNGASSSTLW